MDIWSMTRPALENWFSSRGENPAKAAILLERLYQRGLRDFSELPFAQRVISALSEEFTMELPETVARSGDDSTEKLLREYPDGSLVESVLMRQAYGGSVCVSTQVGCAMGCAFCQSGRLKKRRSLTAGEIMALVMKIRRECSADIHSVTVMGIGEPFDNFDAVRDFCANCVDYKALALGEKHVTVSTCGIIPGIRARTELPHPCSLAVSLHAADYALRSEIMPVNRRYPVREVIAAAREFARHHNSNQFRPQRHTEGGLAGECRGHHYGPPPSLRQLPSVRRRRPHNAAVPRRLPNARHTLPRPRHRCPRHIFLL